MVTTYPNQAVGNQMINALVAQEMRRQEAARQAELSRIRAELGVRRGRDARYYARQIAEARERYGNNKPIGRVRGILLGLLGMAVLIVKGANEDEQ